jgi:hypothetical protein
MTTGGGGFCVAADPFEVIDEWSQITCGLSAQQREQAGRAWKQQQTARVAAGLPPLVGAPGNVAI